MPRNNREPGSCSWTHGLAPFWTLAAHFIAAPPPVKPLHSFSRPATFRIDRFACVLRSALQLPENHLYGGDFPSVLRVPEKCLGYPTRINNSTFPERRVPVERYKKNFACLGRILPGAFARAVAYAQVGLHQFVLAIIVH